MTAPVRLTIRSYQVGFGDCFLLSFDYGDSERHVLMDFGSTSLPKDAPKTRMMDVARDIRKRCGDAGLAAVVATHRHKDHVSGFDPGAGGKGSGAIIRALKPKLVVQPWTEDPDLDPKATAPVPAQGAKGAHARQVAALSTMNSVAELVWAESRRSPFFSRELKAQLNFLGEDNIKNAGAVKNLQDMGDKGEARYVHFGSDAGFGPVLPGVKVHVLGPPTIKQSDAVRSQKSRDVDEFWHLQARAIQLGAADAGNRRAGPLFPDHVAVRAPGRFPVDQRWFVHQVRRMRGDQLLQIVRILDNVLNNTSVILLFEINGRYLLFPGDAQIENWAYALSRPTIRRLLSKVDVYKVGHHGSLNATPKTLWNLFGKRSQLVEGARLVSLLSTLGGKHGHETSNTEVPRRTLVNDLRKHTDHFSTETLSGPDFYHDTTLELT